MSVETPQARVYARALLEAAGSAASAVESELNALAEVSRTEPDTWDALVGPQAASAQRHAAVDKLAASSQAVTRNFLKVLVDRGRLAELPSIAAEYSRLVQELQNQLDVHVTSAVELSGELKRTLEQRLSSSTGKQVTLHASVDPRIIGGLVVQHGDTLVDTSLRGRLEQLRLALRQGPLHGGGSADASSTTTPRQES